MSLPRPTAVLLDWDETMIHGWPVIRDAMNDVLVGMGKDPWEDSKVRECLHNSGKRIFRELFDTRAPEAEEIYLRSIANNTDKIRLQPKAQETLETLHAHGIYMAVVSSKRGPLLRKEVTHFGFDKYFQKVVGAGDAETDKPTSAPVLMALNGRTADKNVWLIGDSMSDLKCAHNAGLSAILVEINLPPEEQIASLPPAARVKDHAALIRLIEDTLAQEKNA